MAISNCIHPANILPRIVCLAVFLSFCDTLTPTSEGTQIHYPDHCTEPARALEPSMNQSVPVEIVLQNPTSAVYYFTFDYDMGNVRRDAGRYSIRMDYSNVQGYWKAVVDSEGVKKRSLKELVDRFDSSKQDNWFDKFNNIDTSNSSELSDLTKTQLRHLVFSENQMCTTNGGETGQEIAATIDGVLEVDFYYGFSLIAT